MMSDEALRRPNEDVPPPATGRLRRAWRRHLRPAAAWAAIRRVAGRELPLLLVPVLVVGAVWGFCEVADEVVEGTTQTFDEAVLRALRDPEDPTRLAGPRRIAAAARDVTALGSGVVLGLATAFAAGFLLIRRTWRGAALLLVAVIGGALLSDGLKGAFERARPSVVPALVVVEGSYAFPSGHSLMSAVVYLTLATMLARLVTRRRLKIYLVGAATMLVLLVGVSRVYLGAHYPSDVVAGWLMGVAWASLCWLVEAWLQARGQVEECVEANDGEPEQDALAPLALQSATRDDRVQM